MGMEIMNFYKTFSTFSIIFHNNQRRKTIREYSSVIFLNQEDWAQAGERNSVRQTFVFGCLVVDSGVVEPQPRQWVQKTYFISQCSLKSLNMFFTKTKVVIQDVAQSTGHAQHMGGPGFYSSTEERVKENKNDVIKKVRTTIGRSIC